jgi:tRNA-dihydrouridine synthase B
VVTLYLAPIRGITDSVFRTAFANIFGGFDRSIAPFVRMERGVLTKGPFRDLQPELNRELCTVPQILSRDPEEFLLIAERFGDFGYREVNWNIGCPFPMVTKKGAGAGILPYPERVDRFLTTVMSRTKLQISIKMRIGFKSESEIEHLWPVLNPYPLAEITVHPRTAKQMYDGRANVAIFEQCIASTDHKLVYSGDIETVQDFEALKIRLPSIRHWMLGRGALYDPFLPGKIKGKEEGEREGAICLFHDQLFRHYREKLSGPGHLLSKMLAIWAYLSTAVPNGKRFAKKIKKARDINHYETLVEQFIRNR